MKLCFRNRCLLCCGNVRHRYQKLRKKAGLTVTDVVELYYQPAAADDGGAVAEASEALLSKIVDEQAEYLKQALGVELQPLSSKPAHHVVITEEVQSVGGGTDEVTAASFLAVIAAPPGSTAAAAAGGVQQMSLA
jgi:hypothetical protein